MLMVRRVVLTGVLGILVGCGGGHRGVPSNEPGLNGKVTYKGSPVTGGSLILKGTGAPITMPIQPDGSYGAGGLPVGEFQVGVDTESLKKTEEAYHKAASEAMAKLKQDLAELKVPEQMTKDQFMKTMEDAAKGALGPAPVGKYMQVPQKYADPATSGLTVTISKGPQTKDFNLTD